MLINLHVKNLALIEEENIDFENGLNILSGETGAGKSIILGSINAALGAKTSPDFIRSGCEYGLTEVTFSVPEDSIDRIKELGVIDVSDGELIISRKITPSKSQIKVNGQSFTASQTRLLAKELIDIHGQHDNQILMDEENHIKVIDEYGFASLSSLKDNYKTDYKEFIRCKKELDELSFDDEDRQREQSFLEFEVNELEQANLKPGEDVQIETEYKRLNNHQKIANELSIASNLLNEGQDNISDMISEALRALINASEYDDELSQSVDTLSDIESLISDVSRNISSYMENFSFDNQEFIELENRLDIINSLKMKYGNSIETILKILDEKKQRLEEFSNFDEVYARKKNAYDCALTKVKSSGKKLSLERKKLSKILIDEIKSALSELNFLEVEFDAVFDEQAISPDGVDSVRFMISTNPGEDMKPLSKIASGGELSRIMLAIKSVMAESDINKTLIFDEIDSGISGKTAQMVAEKLSEISNNHQVICITHLPQIAAMADEHYVIEKSTKDNRTISNINSLSYDESIDELARMLGGSLITDAVIENAKELKNQAKQFKTK